MKQMKTISLIVSFRIRIIFLIGYCLFSFALKSQDAHFSQFYFSPLSMNPSLTGAFYGKARLLVNYRNQWNSISTAPYQTFAFSYDMGMKKKRGKTGFLGAGVSFLSDKAGDSELSLNQINLSLAYHVLISADNSISAGIQGGFAQRSINFNKLQWDNQYNGDCFDPNLPSYEYGYLTNQSYADFAAGIQWTYTKAEMYATANNHFIINAGAAVFHVNRPDFSFYSSFKDNLPIKVVIHGTSQIGIKSTRYSIVPTFEYMQQGPLKNIIAGILIRKKLVEESKYTGYRKETAISFGGLCRLGDAIIPNVQMEFSNYAVGLSYDVNISGLRHATSGKGGIEIFLRFINPKQPKIKTRPKF